MENSTRPIFRIGKKNTDLGIPMKSDVPHLFKWFNDTEVTKYLGIGFPQLEQNEVDWIDRLAKDKLSNQVFIIVTKEGIPIGNIGLHRIDWVSRVATFGIAIGEKEYWGKGHGSEALLLLLEYALMQMNLHKIELDVHDFNPRAIASYKKCGFFEEGRRLRHMWKDGGYHDTIQMGVFRENFTPVWEEYQRG